MFKILVIQATNNLSDERAEFLATTKIGMANLVYNIKRLIFLRNLAIA
jgi:hypothetical protein